MIYIGVVLVCVFLIGLLIIIPRYREDILDQQRTRPIIKPMKQNPSTSPQIKVAACYLVVRPHKTFGYKDYEYYNKRYYKNYLRKLNKQGIKYDVYLINSGDEYVNVVKRYRLDG